MGDDQLYDEDAAFLPDVDEADTAFSADFDPSEAGKPYWEPAAAPEPGAPLMTPEEFIAQFGYGGVPGATKPGDA